MWTLPGMGFLSNPVELTWHGEPTPIVTREQARREFRWMALRTGVCTAIISAFVPALFRFIDQLATTSRPEWTVFAFIALINAWPILLFLSTLAPIKHRKLGREYTLRGKGLYTKDGPILGWSAYKAFRVINVDTKRREIEFIGNDNLSRTIPMPADVDESTVLAAIGKHLAPYRLGEHGVVEKRYPIPTPAAWLLAGMVLLVLACLFGVRHEVDSLLSVFARDSRGPVCTLMAFCFGPIAFALWCIAARSQLEGVRSDRLFAALCITMLCTLFPAMGVLMLDPIAKTYKEIVAIPETERSAVRQTEAHSSR